MRYSIRTVLVTLTLAASACAPGSETGIGDQLDPTSTAEIVGPGGAVAVARTLDDIAAHADVAVVATVSDVKVPRFTTEDGRFPSGLFRRGDELILAEMSTITPVVLTVTEVLGVNPFSDLSVQSGDQLEVILPGGGVEYSLVKEQLEALGFEAEEFFDEESGENELPESALLFRGVGPSIRLDEGDNILVFLTSVDQTYVAHDWSVSSVETLTVVSSLSGTFRYVDERLTTTPLHGEPLDVSESEVRAAAESLDAREHAPLRSG